MKLPTSKERFLFISMHLPLLAGSVVSGVHVEIRSDDFNPETVCFYLCIDQVHDISYDYISEYGKYIFCARSLEELMKDFDKVLVPVRDVEMHCQEMAALEMVEEEEGSDGQRGPESISGVQEETGKRDHADHDRGKFSVLHPAFIDVMEVPPAVTSSQGGGPLG
ncbi:MAG: hypothetical protein NC305_12760 [Lachnospiraceae bacterium]|nr:hypothetical protein [Lachnospiraceae bacterium]